MYTETSEWRYVGNVPLYMQGGSPIQKLFSFQYVVHNLVTTYIIYYSLIKWSHFVIQNVTWPLTTKVGCGHMMCDVFFETTTVKLFNIDFYVCKFNPIEYKLSRTLQLRADRGPCTDTDGIDDDGICPSNLPFCVDFESEVLGGVFNNPGLKYCGKDFNCLPLEQLL